MSQDKKRESSTAKAILQAVNAAVTEPLRKVEDVATAVVEVASQLGIPKGVWEDLTGNTITYYRRLGAVSSPEGRTVKSVYGRRHVIETLGAKLVGASVATTLTLGEVSKQWGRLSDADLLAEVAILVDGARALLAPRPLVEVTPTIETATGVIRGTVVQAGSAQVLLPVGYPSTSIRSVARLVALVIEAGERSDAEVAEMERRMGASKAL